MTGQRMLYKAPGPHAIHGGQFDYVVVDEGKVDAALAAGWFLTTPDAKKALEDQKAADAAALEQQAEDDAKKALADSDTPPTREELEQMATKLGLPFSARVGDKKLAAMVRAAVSTTDEG